ncbi:MAG: ATPase, T2SS/T4P/T4SS family, partial [Planctomycetota bacterium]
MRRLGDILTEMGFADAQAVDEAFSSKPKGVMVGDWLVQQRVIKPRQLGLALAEQFRVPYADIDTTTINTQVVRLVPEDFARSASAAAVDVADGKLTLAMIAPDDIETIAEVELMTGYQIQPCVTLAKDIETLISRAYDDRAVARQTIVDLKITELKQAIAAGEDEPTAVVDDQHDAPVVRLVQAILSGAATAGASDVHLEPHKPEMRVRYRVDGELQQVMTIPNHIEDSVVSRIKVMADMDTTESRRPQDGHLTVTENGKRVGFRVSGIPTVDGQKLVLRLLDEGGQTFDLANIGMVPRDYELIRT